MKKKNLFYDSSVELQQVAAQDAERSKLLFLGDVSELVLFCSLSLAT